MDTVRNLLENGFIQYLDYAFARVLARRFGERRKAVLAAAALTSSVTCQGHVCLDLENPAFQLAGLDFDGRQLDGILQPRRLTKLLAESPAVGFENDYKPLILSGNKLYLNRYFNYEKAVAHQVVSRCRKLVPPADTSLLAGLVERYFGPDRQPAEVNWAKVAAVAAACTRFCIVSGGPGTGKTHTAARIIALLLAAFPERVRRVYLAAPTGKAAARLEDSISKARQSLNLEGHAAAAFPRQAATIHRLLGLGSDGHSSRYNIANPLPADLVIIDEASMVDLALMHKLLEALLPDTQLVLLGDKDQLASVEAGSVLGDLCGRSGKIRFSTAFAENVSRVCRFELPSGFVVSQGGDGLVDHVVFLRKSYRFDPGGGIGALARAINAGRVDKVMDLLADPEQATLEWVRPGGGRDFKDQVQKTVLENYSQLFLGKNAEQRLGALEKFKILCAVQRGSFGVEQLNRMAEAAAFAKGLIPARWLETWPWYPGRPVMILQNDYRLQLFNGDTGVAVVHASGGNAADFKVDFLTSGGQIRQLAIEGLPALQTVFATTIHRSQGSEFDKVFIVLPERDNPLLTRELLYTAVTRARRRVTIWADESILARAVQRRLHRASGLEARLWTENS